MVDFENKIQELQILEQQLQTVLMEKQTFSNELREVENALLEVNKTKGEVYRVLSGAMFKVEKDEMIKELEEKKKIFDMRISAVEKRQTSLEKSLNELKNEVQKSMKKDN
jgi:prefoldin beta subunit